MLLSILLVFLLVLVVALYLSIISFFSFWGSPILLINSVNVTSSSTGSMLKW